MKRLIINNKSKASDYLATNMVVEVIRRGKVSNHGKQYCYGTRFKDGFLVWTDLKKSGTQTFTIINDRHPAP